MKKTILAAFPLLAGCAALPPALPPPPPAQVSAYHGVGTEPFWSLVIDDASMTFTRPDQAPVVQPRPQAIIGIAGEIYKSQRIDVNVVHAQCSDGMSDRVYPDKLQVTVDGTRYNGCGGL